MTVIREISPLADVYGTGPKSHPAGWRAALKDVDDIMQNFKTYGGSMSPYEVQKEGDKWRAALDRNRNIIEQGAIGEFNQSIASFKQAREAHGAAIAKEISRWDPAKLAPQMQVTQMRLEAAINSDDPQRAIAELRDEAQASKDIYIMRAAGEVLKNVSSKTPPGASIEERMLYNRVAKQAERDLQELRNPPELQQAERAAAERFDAMFATQREIRNIGERLHSNTLWRAVARVKVDDRGKLVIEDATDG